MFISHLIEIVGATNVLTERFDCQIYDSDWTKLPGDATIVVSMPGYKDEERKVRLNARVDLEVALSKKSRGGSRPGSGSGSGGGGGGSGGPLGDNPIDPFAPKKNK